jgi:Flp pilus assembly protein TadG
MHTELHYKKGVRRRSAWRTEAGQSILEIALALPIFILMFCGMVDLGRWIFLGIEVSSAARAAVQYGSLNRITAVDNAGMTEAANSDTPDIAGLIVTPKPFCQCSNSLGTNAVCVLGSCPNNRLILFLEVDTSATYVPWARYPGIASSIAVNSKAVMRVGE